MKLSQLPNVGGKISLPNKMWMTPLGNVNDHHALRSFVTNRTYGGVDYHLGMIGAIYDAYATGVSSREEFAIVDQPRAALRVDTVIATGKSQATFQSNGDFANNRTYYNIETAAFITTADTGYVYGANTSDWELSPSKDEAESNVFGTAWPGYRGCLTKIISLPTTRQQMCLAWQNCHEMRDKDGVADKLAQASKLFMDTFGDAHLVLPITLAFTPTYVGVVKPIHRIKQTHEWTDTFGALSDSLGFLHTDMMLINPAGYRASGIVTMSWLDQLKALTYPAPRTIAGVKLDAIFGPCVSDVGVGDLDIAKIVKDELALGAGVSQNPKMSNTVAGVQAPVITEADFMAANADYAAKDSWAMEGWNVSFTAGFTPAFVHMCLSWIMSRPETPSAAALKGFVIPRMKLVL